MNRHELLPNKDRRIENLETQLNASIIDAINMARINKQLLEALQDIVTKIIQLDNDDPEFTEKLDDEMAGEIVDALAAITAATGADGVSA